MSKVGKPPTTEYAIELREEGFDISGFESITGHSRSSTRNWHHSDRCKFDTALLGAKAKRNLQKGLK